MKNKIKWIIIILISIFTYRLKIQFSKVFNDFFSNLDKPLNASLYALIITLIL